VAFQRELVSGGNSDHPAANHNDTLLLAFGVKQRERFAGKVPFSLLDLSVAVKKGRQARAGQGGKKRFTRSRKYNHLVSCDSLLCFGFPWS
jgi:hypothetical protein